MNRCALLIINTVCDLVIILSWAIMLTRWLFDMAVRVFIQEPSSSCFITQPGTRFSLSIQTCCFCSVVEWSIDFIFLVWIVIRFCSFHYFLRHDHTAVMINGVPPPIPSLRYLRKWSDAEVDMSIGTGMLDSGIWRRNGCDITHMSPSWFSEHWFKRKLDIGQRSPMMATWIGSQINSLLPN